MHIVRDDEMNQQVTLQTKNSAFTLIELLLVIAVLSIISALGIMSYRRYFQAKRIDKVAIGMQHVLQAAMSYYVDHNATWPQAHDCGDSAADTSDFVTTYLPNGRYRSYFGSDYCWQDAGAGTAPRQHRLFWVAVSVPGKSPDNVAIAKQLAGRLPNAIATSDPSSANDTPAPVCTEDHCFVRAEITVPGLGAQHNSSTGLAAAGNCEQGTTTPNEMGGNCADQVVSDLNNQGYRISFKACPSSMHPDIVVDPNFVSLPRSHNGSSLVTLSAKGDTCDTTVDTSGNETCTVSVVATICVGNGPHNCKEANVKNYGGSVGASYIISCVPNHNNEEWEHA